MQFQTKGDGVLRVIYYDSREFVSCNFIFPIADPSVGMCTRKNDIDIIIISVSIFNH